MALKRSVAELNALGRNVNQLVRLAHQGANSAGWSQRELLLTIQVCEAMRGHIKDLVKANTHSWRIGHEDVPP